MVRIPRESKLPGRGRREWLGQVSRNFPPPSCSICSTGSVDIRPSVGPPLKLSNVPFGSKVDICDHSLMSAYDSKLTLGTAHALTSAHADRQLKGHDRKDLPLETRIQFSHLHANAFKFRACSACRQVGFACGCVGEGALPSDIRLAAIPARMFDEYFTGWKPDRDAHGGSLTSLIKEPRRPNRA
jgi:hypothetical protein